MPSTSSSAINTKDIPPAWLSNNWNTYIPPWVINIINYISNNMFSLHARFKTAATILQLVSNAKRESNARDVGILWILTSDYSSWIPISRDHQKQFLLNGNRVRPVSVSIQWSFAFFFFGSPWLRVQVREDNTRYRNPMWWQLCIVGSLVSSPLIQLCKSQLLQTKEKSEQIF